MKESKYTCNLCKKTSLVTEYDYPKGWRRIVFDVSNNSYNRDQKILDLCDECAKKFQIEPKVMNDDSARKTIGERLEDIIREIIESNQQGG